ncbi:hypothetical protein ACFRFU_52345 [Streptomyces sp. NPDC056704]|uniref:hypothetical protein n=1 Tax=Streptomyces sp. NPDC056704 TaxID=3345917 RepID=UPI0036A96D8E
MEHLLSLKYSANRTDRVPIAYQSRTDGALGFFGPSPARPRHRLLRPPPGQRRNRPRLAHLDQRATTINAAIAALIRDAGTPTVDDRVRALRTELDAAGLTSMTPTLELALAFHQAVLEDDDGLSATIA